MTKNIIRLTRGGDYITTGGVTINSYGNAQARQRTDEAINYLFEWDKYFTKDSETVTISLSTKNLTAANTDGTDSTTVLISGATEGDVGYCVVSIAITGGETFKIRLDITGTSTV